MRLWHKELIRKLPRQQLLGQWRECCLIAKNINENGYPNHILVNRIMVYPFEHFVTYCYLIFEEMNRRDYNVHSSAFEQYISLPFCKVVNFDDLFDGWHNDRYLHQCLMNLQEKYDCGGISNDEYETIEQSIIIEEANAFKSGYIRGLNEARPHGRWITMNFNSSELNAPEKSKLDFVKCPFCETIHQGRHNFCSFCGADLRGPENE